jgi:putative protein-disulfide isomerase
MTIIEYIESTNNIILILWGICFYLFIQKQRGTSMNPTLYYIHEPMCSWCWGYRPVWDELQKALPVDMKIEYVVGGLAADSDEPMPIAQQQMIQAHWKTIQTKLGTKFNFDFWLNNTPRRSTYNACRAVIAAKKQNAEHEMLDAIQRGYYLRALNPSNQSILIELVRELANQKVVVDVEQFIKDINSVEVQTELIRQIQLARKLTQRGFPSLVLEIRGQLHFIAHDYQDNTITLKEITRHF